MNVGHSMVVSERTSIYGYSMKVSARSNAFHLVFHMNGVKVSYRTRGMANHFSLYRDGEGLFRDRWAAWVGADPLKLFDDLSKSDRAELSRWWVQYVRHAIHSLVRGSSPVLDDNDRANHITELLSSVSDVLTSVLVSIPDKSISVTSHSQDALKVLPGDFHLPAYSLEPVQGAEMYRLAWEYAK